jgi:endonuclease YncB( thermonuclease family)
MGRRGVLTGPRCMVMVLWALLSFHGYARALEFTARVTAVSDGDTLRVLVGREQVRVRLMEIDAPEKRQAFGHGSQQSLASLCFGKDATIDARGRDRYGRTLARATCAGVDVNAEQVRRGMAWVYDKYVTDRSLYRIQEEARAARRGLWEDAAPVAPWDYRKLKRAGGE